MSSLDETAEGPRPMATDHPAGPTDPLRRIAAIDVLRGVALLGILLINVTGFGLPIDAMDDPTVAGGASGVDLAVWAINDVLVEGTFISIFSMLFGAGVILITRGPSARGGLEIADVYFRRNLWLILFGVIHAYVLLMPGDVLYAYGLVALFLFPLRTTRPRNLILAGVVILLASVPFEVRDVLQATRSRAAALEAQAVIDRGAEPSFDQHTALVDWSEDYTRPSPDAAREETRVRRSGYLDIVRYFAPINAEVQTTYFYREGFREIAGMMLLGMGLMKLGAFSATWTAGAYLRLAILGYGLGVPFRAWLASMQMTSGFDPSVMTWGGLGWELGRLPIALGHVGVVLLICRLDILPAVRSVLAAVGRMALTNYLMQTILCTLFFNGYGLGFFARLQRHELYYLVAAIWTVQLVTSPLWTRRHRFGPAEWVWRSLTYGRPQPMRPARPER